MIDYLDTISVSISMSLDACTVNATNGLKLGKGNIIKLFLISFCFGLAQFLMPLLGYLIGASFKQYLESFIPWIAFTFLLLLSIKSLIEFVKERKSMKENVEIAKKNTISIWDILFQSFATSIDALCIGFVYINYNINEALLVFTIIGIITLSLSFISSILANLLAKPLVKWAALISSIVFFLVGLKILLEGLL